ncbi:MAG: BTAD domain-containing putative transcriptional regulator [Pseudonocardiaceae bacterium]
MEFEVLGPLRVRGSSSHAPLTAGMPRTLLGMLLAGANRPVPFDVLVDALWGGRSEPGAIKKLQLHIHRLRRALGDPGRIRLERSGYALRVHPGELDADRFETLLAEGNGAAGSGEPARAVTLIRQALELWRGEPYGDVADVAVLRTEADRLVERHLAAIEQLYDAELASGRAAAIVPELAEPATAHPLRERLQALLMTALYRAGRQADALEVYRRTRTTLIEELSQEPGPELQRLQQAILAADPILEPAAPAAVTPTQLPADVAEFTGRDTQVALVRDQLAGAAGGGPRAVVISAIAGKAGVGKTTLAVHAAHQLSEQFPDGQLHVNLRGAEAHPLDPAEVLARFLHALGADGAAIPEDLDERAAMYRSRLAGKRVLILLDNAARESQVRPLLPGTPECGVLVTSRARLAALPGARLVDLDILEPGQAVELLARIAGPGRIAAEPAAGEQIARLCGYLPLALRIAAGRLAARPDWTVGRLAGALTDERRRLDELRLGDLEVRTSLQLSYDALDATARRVLRRLGMLEAPDFAAWVAAAVLDVPLARARQVLERLVDAQLLDVVGDDSAGQMRYRFHDLLRVFARERLHAEDPAADPTAALERALGGALALTEQATQRLWGQACRAGELRWRPGPAETEALLAVPLAWLDAERVYLVACIEQATGSGLDELAWRLAHSLGFFLDVRGYLDECRRTHEVALAASRRAGSDTGAGYMLRGLGMVHIVQDRYDEAMDCLQQAHGAFRHAGDRHGEADVRCSFGVLYRVLGRPAEALECCRQALPTYREVGDRAGESFALYSHGVLLLEQDRPGDARPYLDQALALYRELRNRRGEGQVLRRMGALHHAEDRLDEAVSCLQRCLDIFDEFGDRQLTGYTLQELGAVHVEQGRRADAESLFHRSLQLLRELVDRHGEARTLLGLGELHHAEAHHDQAVTHLTHAMRIWDSLDLPLWQARARRSLGEVHAAAGDHIAAEALWREALALFTKLGSPEAAELAEQLSSIPEQ